MRPEAAGDDRLGDGGRVAGPEEPGVERVRAGRRRSASIAQARARNGSRPAGRPARRWHPTARGRGRARARARRGPSRHSRPATDRRPRRDRRRPRRMIVADSASAAPSRVNRSSAAAPCPGRSIAIDPVLVAEGGELCRPRRSASVACRGRRRWPAHRPGRRRRRPIATAPSVTATVQPVLRRRTARPASGSTGRAWRGCSRHGSGRCARPCRARRRWPGSTGPRATQARTSRSRAVSVAMPSPGRTAARPDRHVAGPHPPRDDAGDRRVEMDLAGAAARIAAARSSASASLSRKPLAPASMAAVTRVLLDEAGEATTSIAGWRTLMLGRRADAIDARASSGP